jgi:hypothetical protein
MGMPDGIILSGGQRQGGVSFTLPSDPGAADPLTGGGKSGISGAGAVAAASPAVAGAVGE